MAAVAFLSLTFSVSAEVIEASSTVQSPCKDHGEMTRSEFPEMSSTITYDDGVLVLTVRDLMEQCAADLQVTCNPDIPGEIHFIIEDVSEVPANCICPFDVVCNYAGILEGHYKVYLESSWGYVYLETEANIESGCEFSFGNPSGIKAPIVTSGTISFASNDTLLINADGTANVEIYDAEGRLRGSFNVNSPAEVSLATLSKGVYLVNATINGKTERVKIFR